MVLDTLYWISAKIDTLGCNFQVHISSYQIQNTLWLYRVLILRYKRQNSKMSNLPVSLTSIESYETRTSSKINLETTVYCMYHHTHLIGGTLQLNVNVPFKLNFICNDMSQHKIRWKVLLTCFLKRFGGPSASNQSTLGFYHLPFMSYV